MIRADATRPPPSREACDLVFLDPPYRSGQAAPALVALAEAGWLKPGAIATVELANTEDIAAAAGLRDDRRASLWAGQDRDPAPDAMTLTAPLYLLRHGETAWNLERRMQGSKDSALTARGRDQAAAMGRALAAELGARAGPDDLPAQPARPDPRDGARSSAAQLGLDPAEWRDEPRLAELGYGLWEGSTWAEIEVDHPDAMADLARRPRRFLPTRRRDTFRLAPAFGGDAGRDRAVSTRTVVVSHGVSGAVMRGLHLGLDARAMFVLEKPQDAFFRLLAGREERILAAEAVEATTGR